MPLRPCRALIVLVAATVAACQTTAYREDRIYRFLDEIAFGGPLAAGKDRNPYLTRWEVPLKVHVPEADRPERRSEIAEHLEAFERITGLSARLVDDGADANVTVAFKPDPDFLANREHVPCYVLKRWRRGRLAQTEIEISVAEPDKVGLCLAHELMHTYGFGYHSAILRSILSPAHDEETLSEWDELALRILYGPGTTPRMTRQEAEPLFKRRVRELLEAR